VDSGTLKKIAETYGTPTYVYDEERIRENCGKIKREFEKRYPRTRLMYAYKANTNLAICRIVKNEGFGADVVSGGELHAALKTGVSRSGIIFTGNGKSAKELEFAIASGVMINVDSLDELDTLEKILKKKNKKVKISFRINPSVNPKTHPKISTGLRESKFGLHLQDDVALDAYARAKKNKNLEIAGVHMHIGSQITDITPFEEALEKLMQFVLRLKSELGIKLKFVDVGGGLGVRYKDEKVVSPGNFAGSITKIFDSYAKKIGYTPGLWVEPGRFIVADAGILLARAISIKKTPYRNFVNVDAGFNTLIRPAMYDAYHEVFVVGKSGGKRTYDVAGNLCESGDILAKDRKLPDVRRGDLVGIMNAGAYGFSMASAYNSQPLPAEVLVRKNRIELIRERGSYEDLYFKQKVPKDL